MPNTCFRCHQSGWRTFPHKGKRICSRCQRVIRQDKRRAQQQAKEDAVQVAAAKEAVRILFKGPRSSS